MWATFEGIKAWENSAINSQIIYKCEKLRPAGVAHNFLKSTRCRSPDFMVHILKAHIHPILEYASPLWNSDYVCTYRTWRGWTWRQFKALDAQCHWTPYNIQYGDTDRLKEIDLFSVKGRLLRADIIKCWKIFHNLSQVSPELLWDLEVDSRARGHSYTIRTARIQCHVDARARFFTHRVVH